VLLDAEGRILTGSARLLHQRLEENEAQIRSAAAARRRAKLEDRRRVVEAKIAAIRSEFEEELHALSEELEQEHTSSDQTSRTLAELAARRGRTSDGNKS